MPVLQCIYCFVFVINTKFNVSGYLCGVKVLQGDKGGQE